MKSRMAGGACVPALVLWAAARRADVPISETLAMKVAHSGVVAMARFVSVDGTGPFTNARPPC